MLQLDHRILIKLSSLPPGVTDAMCEPYDPMCICGDKFSAHYQDDDIEVVPNSCSRDSESYYGAVEMNAKGEVEHACDALHGKVQCTCTKFTEGEPEPYEDYDDGF